MANELTIQKLVDGPRNAIFKVDVVLDGVQGDFANQMVVQIATLSAMGPGPAAPTRLRVDLLDWDVQDGLAVNLFWAGKGRASMWRMVGRSIEKAYHVGGLQNNADQPNGNITLDTVSSAMGSPLYATFKIHCVKQA